MNKPYKTAKEILVEEGHNIIDEDYFQPDLSHEQIDAIFAGKAVMYSLGNNKFLRITLDDLRISASELERLKK